jgi:hypothetical protein
MTVQIFYCISKTYKLQINTAIILCESEACSLTIREETKTRVFENNVMRRIFEPTGDEVI